MRRSMFDTFKHPDPSGAVQKRFSFFHPLEPFLFEFDVLKRNITLGLFR